MKVHHDEEVANRIDPESCAVAREGIGEALTGERTGQPLSRESTLFPGADVVPLMEGNTDGRVVASAQTARRDRRHWHVRARCRVGVSPEQERDRLRAGAFAANCPRIRRRTGWLFKSDKRARPGRPRHGGAAKSARINNLARRDATHCACGREPAWASGMLCLAIERLKSGPGALKVPGPWLISIPNQSLGRLLRLGMVFAL